MSDIKTPRATKFEELEALEAVLLKARRRLSDEVEDPDDQEESLEDQGYREFDPDEGDDADKWLEQNDPQQEDEENEDEPGYDEYGPDEDEESHQQEPEQDEEFSDQPAAEAKAPGEEGRGSSQEQDSPAQVESPQEAPAQEVKGEGRFPQPSKEDIAEMRQYTRPWEQRAREKTRLEAEPSKNPVLHHEGQLVEARNSAHKKYQDAYAAMQASPDYQNADPISQMEMDSKFESDFHKQNPDYLANAAKLHSEAHKKGLGAKDVHAAAKDEAIRHVLSGGAQAETPMSTEEALQHAGGSKGEEGTVGSMTQDPSSSFAAGNKAFLEQYSKDYANKAKKPKDVSEMMDYDEGSKRDVQRVLGEHPALKDPAKKAKVDAFFQKYHPLIGMNAKKVLNKLGLESKGGQVDLGMLHEAGMHGLMQAINDYDHDHPSKAAFSTHASNKIRGLQQTALRAQDQVPQELRIGAKKFQQAQAAPVAKPDIKGLVAKHPPEVADRMKRIDTFKQIAAPKMPKPQGGNNE